MWGNSEVKKRDEFQIVKDEIFLASTWFVS